MRGGSHYQMYAEVSVFDLFSDERHPPSRLPLPCRRASKATTLGYGFECSSPRHGSHKLYFISPGDLVVSNILSCLPTYYDSVYSVDKLYLLLPGTQLREQSTSCAVIPLSNLSHKVPTYRCSSMTFSGLRAHMH